MNFLKIKLLVIAAVIFASSSAFASYSYNIDVNTSSVVGQNGYIDLTMTTNSNNIATAKTSNFSADPSFSFGGTPVLTGNASGLLANNNVSITTSSSVMYSDYFQAVTFGNDINFNLLLSGAPSSGTAFTLAFYNSDQSAALFSTTDPSTGTGAATQLNFTANGVDVLTTSNETTVTPTPIPAAVYLLGSGLMGLAGIRRRNQK
jgi:hypothetical protein